MTWNTSNEEDINAHRQSLELPKALKIQIIQVLGWLSAAFGLFAVTSFVVIGLVLGASISRVPFIPFFAVSLGLIYFFFHFVFLYVVDRAFIRERSEQCKQK